jgi:probable rRNA maturation factor
LSSQDDSEPFQLDIREEDVSLPVDRELLVDISRQVFRDTGSAVADISLVVCTDAFIQELNSRYRNRTEPTDVLSFSLREGFVDESSPSPRALGDIVISVETVKRQSGDDSRSLEEEFLHIYLHGLLHLLGFTHETDGDEQEMNTIIEKTLSEV